MSAPLGDAACDAVAVLAEAMRLRPLCGAIESGESPDPTYRYVLWRVVNPVPRPRWLSVTMVNPSKASFEKTDQTIDKLLRFLAAWEYDGMIVTNLFAFRSTEPKALKTAAMPVGPLNDAWILAAAALASAHVVAWGTSGGLNRRDRDVLDLLSAQHDLRAIRVTQGGMPEHPLYLPENLRPEIYRARKNPCPAL